MSPRPDSAEFPVNFPVSREFASRDRFASDCVRHHAVRVLSCQRAFVYFDSADIVVFGAVETGHHPSICADIIFGRDKSVIPFSALES